MKPSMTLTFRKNMTKYWPILGSLVCLAGFTVLLLFVPLNSANHVSLKIKYKYPLIKDRSLNTDDEPSTTALNKGTSDLQKFIGSKQEDLTSSVTKINEIAQKLSSVSTILDTILSNNTLRNTLPCQSSVPQEQKSTTQDHKSVVSKVYNNQIDNFDSVVNYVDSIRFDVFDNLYKEMKANGHKDIRKLLLLSESLQKGISIASNSEIVAKTRSLISTLWNENHEAAIQPISDAFLNNNSWPIVKQLTKAINSTCTDCIDHVYTKVIENILHRVNVIDLLKLAKANLKCLDECVSIHQAVFNKLDETSSSYSDTVISLARHIKATMDDPNYKNIHPDLQTRHKEIKNKLPLSLKNAVFSSSLCIKNPTYNEYFFASSWLATSSGLKEVQEDASGNSLRSVFTWIGGDRPGNNTDKFKWRLSFLEDDKFALINEAFNEYVFLSSETFDTNGRIPYTKRLPYGAVTDLFGLWSFEVEGDHVYIKNAHLNEFLFAHKLSLERGERRRVVTYIPKGRTESSEWEVIDCTDFH